MNATTMQDVHVGRGTTHGAMTVFPLWSAATGRGRYTVNGVGLDVTEMPGGPSVSSLLIGNTGDEPALVLAGQLFEGGWQHRMSLGSVLIGVRDRLPVPVACVEQGRWGGATAPRGTAQNSCGRRASPFVRDSVRRGTDVQSTVWERVAGHVREEEVRTSTRDDRHDPRGRNATQSFVDRLDRAEEESRTWSRLRALPGQIGVMIGIGGQPLVAELFDSPTRLQEQLETLLTSAAIDARLAAPLETPGRRARRFLTRAREVRLQGVDGPGLGHHLAGRTSHVDVTTLRWTEPVVSDLHTTLTNVRHPLLVA